MKQFIKAFVAAFIITIVLGAIARAECPLDKPEVISFSADHYYTALQWSALPSVEVLGPNPFKAPVAGDPSAALWYLSIHKDGSQNPVLLEPSPAGTVVKWTFSQKLLSNGCYEAFYQGQGIKDAPFAPAFCVYGNPLLPKDCEDRVDASFPAEIPAWQVVDSENVSSDITVGKPCFDQGPPLNAGDRGAVCQGPANP